MAIFHPHTVRCPCGNRLEVQLADSVNVKRQPEARQRILSGELHRAACSACGQTMTVEKPFYYTDFDRNVLFKVLPTSERHTWKQASTDLDKASGFIPADLSDAGARTLRVLFGMDELREKIVAQDANIDDRLLELLKVLVVYEHPILLKWARLRLVLEEVTETELRFSAGYEHDQRRFHIAMPKDVADDLADHPEMAKKWAAEAHHDSVFKLPDHWVNMWRWSPQPTALDRLRNYAQDIEQNRSVDTASSAFKAMLLGLPPGRQLPGWAKQDVRTLFKYAKRQNLQTLQDKLFELRFGIDLEDEWSTNNDLNDIDTLWDLLKDLPDTNVEGNTKIREITLIDHAPGFYIPQDRRIEIGSSVLAQRERFEDVVRHEVGHAVHENNTTLVNGWLAQRFGWRIFGRRDDEIDQWVALLGGWGGLNEMQRRDVRRALQTAIGSGSSWVPGGVAALPQGHPWNGASFGPRLAFEKTGPHWYQNFRTWHRANGKAFFLNYWYQTFLVVDVAALDLVASMPSDYAAMSHYEFFAELYALFYDLDDPKRGVIPADVSAWLDANIGAPRADALLPAALAAPAPPREWETIARPAAKVPGKASKSGPASDAPGSSPQPDGKPQRGSGRAKPKVHS
jgi:hypothetical protein